MNAELLITAAARSIASLAPAVSGADRLQTERADIARAAERGYFTPQEDERVRARFAEYLSARAALHQTIMDLKPLALASPGTVNDELQIRAFVIAYTAAGLLVQAARFVVHQYASESLVQRKLNEAEPRFGIPRKQFTAIYKSLTNPFTAWRLREAMRFAQANRQKIDALTSDPLIAPLLPILHGAEHSLGINVTDHLKERLRYRWHSWRRRNVSAVNHAMFGLFEISGRVVADIRWPWHRKRITPSLQQQIGDLLRPGDVLISRHDDAASNLFLPGYWIHASLHIGREAVRHDLNVDIDPIRAARWVDPICVLEARKDGVRLRPLDDTLGVDAIAVLRPRLEQSHLAQGLSRALTHEGKLYDFEFDFFRSDRLVCTEVVYRAYDGLGPIRFTLTPRAGRMTLSAEDLIEMAMRGEGFEPVAVAGAPGCARRLATGKRMMRVLERIRRRRAAKAMAQLSPR